MNQNEPIVLKQVDACITLEAADAMPAATKPIEALDAITYAECARFVGKTAAFAVGALVFVAAAGWISARFMSRQEVLNDVHADIAETHSTFKCDKVITGVGTFPGGQLYADGQRFFYDTNIVKEGNGRCLVEAYVPATGETFIYPESSASLYERGSDFISFAEQIFQRSGPPRTEGLTDMVSSAQRYRPSL